jgi:hypothetical protein
MRVTAMADDRAPLDVPNAELSALLALWRGRGAQGRLPARADFTVQDFRPWLGHLCILEVLDGDLRYALYGTAITEIFGWDLTGRRISGLAPDVAQRLAEEYRPVVADGRPVFFSNRRLVRKEWAHVDKLALPLGADGVHVDRLIVGIYARS